METVNMLTPFNTYKAWTRPGQHGAVYKVGDQYLLYCWGFLKGHKYKYLKEAKAVLDALNRLGELEGGAIEVEARFEFEPKHKPY